MGEPKRTSRNFFSLLIEIFLYSVIAALAVTMVMGLFTDSQAKWKYQTYVIQSGSMEPTIMTGDVVLVQSQGQYQLNDVVTYNDSTGRVVTHRLVEEIKDKNSFVTKGDANQNADSRPIESNQVQGKVVFTFPKLGYLVRFVQTKTGKIVFIIIPIVVMICEETIKIMSEVSTEIF